MSNQNDTLSPQQSLDLITQMIDQAKGNVRNSSYYFLLWGWAVILAHMGAYMLIQLHYQNPYFVWIVIIPVAWIFTIVRGIQQAKQTKITTHLDRVYQSMWTGYGVFAVTISFILGQYINYQIDAVLLMAASVCTFTTGFIIRFNPMKFGSVALFLGGASCFFVDMLNRNLVAAAAIALGYLVPGYLLRRTKR